MALPPFGVSGHIVLTTHLADHLGEPIPGTARERARFDNLITDTGLDLIGVGNDISNACVGSGSTAPANTDTALAAQISAASSLNTSSTSYNASPEYGQRTTVFRFGAGAAAGNLAEVGVKYSSSLYARALILDGGGSPTTITVLAGEILDVTYIQRIVPPAADASGSVVINGITYGWVARPANVGTWYNAINGGSVGYPTIQGYFGSIGARASSPGGGGVGASCAASAYTPGSKTRSYTGTFAIGASDLLITAATLNAQAYWQFSFDSGGIPKLSTQTLALTLANSWARA